MKDLSIETRNDAKSIFMAGVNSAHPKEAIVNTLSCKTTNEDADRSVIQSLESGNFDSVIILAFGKASILMTEGALSCISPQFISETPLVITNYENLEFRNNMEILGASHPIPNNDGLNAAKHVVKIISRAKKGQLVLALISGGASALLPSPPSSISLEEKCATTQLLLDSGASIHEINTVRKHISTLKGGQFAGLVRPASLHSLILSDVLDNNPTTIASGMASGDPTTFSESIAICRRNNLWGYIPNSVKKYLEDGLRGIIRETPSPDNSIFDGVGHTIVGSNTISLYAMNRKAKALGYRTQIISKSLAGEARNAGENLASYLLEPVQAPTAYLAGGETTVNVTGAGVGGRNQELSLAFALKAHTMPNQQPWVFLSAGTDGIDGPTDAAGGIVDQETILRISGTGQDPEQMLVNNDAYHALTCSSDILITGSTGTNVADLQVLLVHPI